MEPLEVIDLSSDDENSPPKKTVGDESKKASPKNNNDVKILSNVATKRKSTIDDATNGSCSNKRLKLFKKEDPVSIVANSLHNKKTVITSEKVIVRRIKPETLSPLSAPRGSGSKPTTERNDKNNLKTCDNAVETSDVNSNLENKSSNSKDSRQSFKINEGASSSWQTKTPHLKVMNTIKVSAMVDTALTPSTEAFESLLETCRSQEPGRDMEIIISKFRKRFKNLEPSYARSGSFIQFLRNKKNVISNSKAKLYLHISEVMDEMKARQIKNRAAVREKKKRGGRPLADFDKDRALSDIPEEDSIVDEKDSESLDSQDDERLLILNKAMRRCERCIIKCEEAEVDFDDESDSHYMMAEKYKERMVQLYNKYCEITGERADAARPYLRPKHLNVTPLPTLNNVITSFINMQIIKMNKSLVDKSKKCSQLNFTDALIFPDYPDILECVEKCNEDEGLQLSKTRVSDIAKNAFLELGKHLQHCRQRDYYDTFSLYLEKEDCDPALEDESLAQKLRENQKYGKEKLDQVFQEYVEKQNAAKSTANGSNGEKEQDPGTTGESSDDSDDEDSDDHREMTDSASDETDCEFNDLDSKLRNEAEPKTRLEVKLPDNDRANEKNEMKEDGVSNEEDHEGDVSLAVQKNVRKNIDADTSDRCAEQIADVKIVKKKDAETILRQDSVQQTETKNLDNKVIESDQPTSETADHSNIEVIAPAPSPIEEPTSTVATCKLNVVETSQTSKINLTDKCLPVIAANDSEVIDAPAVALSIKAGDKEEEPQPKLRLRPFAKPPGSWKDFQAPPKNLAPENKTTGIPNTDTEKQERQEINKPTEHEQNLKKFIKINKPTPVGRMVQVTKDVLINLTNKSSVVLIPPNSNKSNPQINVKTVTNNVTLNFNNPSPSQTKVTSISPKNLVRITDNGKIITRYSNVGVINATSNKDKVPAGSVLAPTVRYNNQMIPIKSATNQVRMVGPQTTATPKVQRLIAPNMVPVVDKNGTEKLYRIVKRPLGANPPRIQNIIVPATTTAVQNQMPRTSNQRPNSNLETVPGPNVKIQVSNSIRNILPLKVPRQSSKNDDKAYETSTGGVPTYQIE